MREPERVVWFKDPIPRAQSDRSDEGHLVRGLGESAILMEKSSGEYCRVSPVAEKSDARQNDGSKDIIEQPANQA
jgi:hypothetical protein